MATTGTALLTWEQFEQLPDSDGFHRELIEGELQQLPPARLRHSRVAKRAFRALFALEERGLGEVLLEAGYKLSLAPATWVQPDVSFVRRDRAVAADEDGYHQGAPNLAVEVVSPSESAPDLQRKVELLLAAGSEAVWVAYPTAKRIVVHLPDGTSYTLGVGDTLDAPYLLPGWKLRVVTLFED